MFLVKFLRFYSQNIRQTSWGIGANMLDDNIVVNEFKLWSRYDVYFQANTLGKDMKPLIPPAMG